MPRSPHHQLRPGAYDLDTTAILLDRSGRVRSDADFVFYNQPTTPDGAIRHTGAAPGGATACETLDIALNGLHLDIHRVVAAVSVDGGRFADDHDLRVSATTTNPATEYVFQPDATVETALVCLEIYPPRRDLATSRRRTGLRRRPGRARPRFRRRRRLTRLDTRIGADQFLRRVADHSPIAPRSGCSAPQPAAHDPPTHPRPR
jgi:stress response protein SCP2